MLDYCFRPYPSQKKTKQQLNVMFSIGFNKLMRSASLVFSVKAGVAEKCWFKIAPLFHQYNWIQREKTSARDWEVFVAIIIILVISMIIIISTQC